MRPFNEKERLVIDRDLRSTGRTLFATHGWKKTGIDDLCRAAGIARGTFYHFYASKEAFFLALLAEAETTVKQELLVFLSDPALDGPSTLRALLETCLTVIDRHPLLQFAFADPADAAPWLRNVDSESIDVLVRDDDETAQQVLSLLAAKGVNLALPAAELAGLLRALTLVPLSKRTIGPVYERVRDALAATLTRGFL